MCCVNASTNGVELALSNHPNTPQSVALLAIYISFPFFEPVPKDLTKKPYLIGFYRKDARLIPLVDFLHYFINGNLRLSLLVLKLKLFKFKINISNTGLLAAIPPLMRLNCLTPVKIVGWKVMKINYQHLYATNIMLLSLLFFAYNYISSY